MSLGQYVVHGPFCAAITKPYLLCTMFGEILAPTLIPSMHCGSGEVFFRVKPLSPLLCLSCRPMTSKGPNVWRMTKKELMAYADALDITYHESWTREEIRAIIQEYKEAKGTSKVPKGLASMTLVELQQKATELCIQYPAKASKGHLQKLIPDGTRAPSEEIVSFGRYKNYMCRELPEGYLSWAIRNTNSSDDLRRLAKWAETREKKKGYTTNDPKVGAKIPYVPLGASSSGTPSSWLMAEQRPVTPPTSTTTRSGKDSVKSIGSRRPRESEHSEVEKMEQDVPESVVQEVQALQARLAGLMDKYNMTTGPGRRGDAGRGSSRSSGQGASKGKRFLLAEL